MAPEDLLRRVHSAYERGRLRRALWTSSVVVPMVVASFGGCGRASTSVGIGAVLAVLVSYLVWRGGDAGEAVRPGLVAGLASLAFPLVACRAMENAGIEGTLPLAACVVGGLASGAIVTRHATRRAGNRTVFAFAGGAIASLTGSLGCVSAGAGGIAAMIVGVLVVTPLAFARATRPS
jgi:hypothetical protein